MCLWCSDSCLTCNELDKCLTCRNSTMRPDPSTGVCQLITNLTIQTCPSGTFGIYNSTGSITSCEKCHPFCATCWDGLTEKDCLTCQTNVTSATGGVWEIFKIWSSNTTNKVTCGDQCIDGARVIIT